MANVLKREKQEAVIRCLMDGMSLRATERVCDVHRDTAMRLMVRVGEACERTLDREMRGLQLEHCQLDEIWTFCGRKQRRLRETDDESRMGDFWVFIALDERTKLIPSYKVGKRTMETTLSFVTDLAARVEGRLRLSSDSMPAYVDAIDQGFGRDANYSRLVKVYEGEPVGPGRYSPPRVVRV